LAQQQTGTCPGAAIEPALQHEAIDWDQPLVYRIDSQAEDLQGQRAQEGHGALVSKDDGGNGVLAIQPDPRLAKVPFYPRPICQQESSRAEGDDP
jgi:hypothetical protein